MRVFCAVVEEGAFSRAARRLRLSNAAVSTHVARLEADLETRLLHRTTRSLGLTAAGRAYYRRVARLLDELDTLEQQIRDGDTPAGLLRVAVPMSFGLSNVAPRLPAFLATYPKVEVELMLADRIVDVVAEGVDLALRVGARLPDSSLIATRLCPFPRALVAAPRYLAEAPPLEAPADLRQHSCLRYTGLKNPDQWTLHGPDGVVETVRVEGRLSADNSLALRGALVAGLGIAQVPEPVVADDLASGALVRCLTDWAPEPRSVFALYPSTRHLSPKVRAFVRYFREALAA